MRRPAHFWTDSWKNITGQIRATAELSGSLAQPRGRIQLDATGLALPPQGIGATLPPAHLAATAILQAGAAQLTASASAGASHLQLTGLLPLTAAGALGLNAQGMVDLALIDPLLAAQGRNLRGRASLEASARGTLAAPDLSGMLRLTGGAFQDFVHGVRVRDIAATIAAQGTQLRIIQASGRAGDGTIALAGTLDLAAALPVDLTLTARKAELLSSDQARVALDADLALRGALADAARLSGTVRIDSATLRIPEAMPQSTPFITIIRPGAPPPPPAPPWPISLDVAITAPNQVFVRGHGLDAVVTGQMRVAGSLAQPQTIGGLTLQRGSYSLAGTTLRFTSGTVRFGGGAIDDPAIDFIARSTTSTLTATLEVAGTIAHPKLILTSTPSLPPDEVLAQILFGRNIAQLGPLQLAQMAQGLAALGGVSSSLLDPLGRVRQLLGLDQLSVGSSATPTHSPTLEAGRYVAPGIYVGAKQGLTGGSTTSGTQATVQIDIGHGLKLEGDVGTGAGGNAAGLTYELEY